MPNHKQDNKHIIKYHNYQTFWLIWDTNHPRRIQRKAISSQKREKSPVWNRMLRPDEFFSWDKPW